jgi:hypothetical protein
MLVSTIAITVVVAVGVIGWRAVRGDDDGGPGQAGEWDEIALVNRSTGDVTFIDDDGDVTGTVVGAGRVSEVLSDADRIVLVGADRIVLAANDGSDPVDLPIERSNTVTVLPTIGTFHLAIGDVSGGNVTIVDATTGETFDVGGLADQNDPLMFAETVRHASDGSAFAVADAANFQTIVVRPSQEGPTFFPDQPVAVGDQLVATSQVVGQEADITLYDAERNPEGFGTVEIPVGGVMVGDDLVVVSVEGTVFRLGRGAREAERLAEVAVPAGGVVRWVRATADQERLVVFGDVFEAVIDLDGQTVFTTTFTTPVVAPSPALDWACLPIGGTGGYHSLIALDSGEQLADLTGFEVSGTSSDGCTLLGERADVTEVISAEGTTRLGRLQAATLGPDGRSIVSRTTTGRVELLRIDDDLEVDERIDLTETAPANVAVAFLDR